LTIADSHARLSRGERQLLCTLADPDGGLGHFREPGVDSLARVLTAAGLHGVLPIVWRRLRGSGLSCTATPAALTASQDLLAEAERQVTLVTGISMLLAHHGTIVMDAFRAANIDAAMIKGPVFARHLYTAESDRSYTDIDILVAPRHLSQANAVIGELGYQEARPLGRDPEAYGEFKWLLPGNDAIMIEVQANLAHAPKLRHGLSLEYGDILEAGDGDPQSPVPMLMVAAVHAAAGHQFDRLQHGLDIVQAARLLPEKDIPNLVRATRKINGCLALVTALNLAQHLFGEPKAGTIAGAFRRSVFMDFAGQLITPRMVLDAQSSVHSRASWRRKLFREFLARKRTA
jgi:hypothetical protein